MAVEGKTAKVRIFLLIFRYVHQENRKQLKIYLCFITEMEKKIKGSNERTESEDPSPRCVLEIPATSSDSDNSSSCSSCSPDKSSSSPLSTTATNGRQWNKMIESIKKKSIRRFSVIPLLASYELTRKNMRRKQPKLSPSPDNVFDCDQFLVAKPSWRNFTYDELVAATDGFNSGKD